MKSLIRFKLLSLALVVGVALGMAQHVSASTLASPLPTIKEPSSARFDITGTLDSPDLAKSGLNIGFSGDGAISNGRVQENITVNISGGQLPAGTGNVTVSVIYADGKFYIKTSGLGTGAEDKWYVTDIPAGTDMSSTGLAGLNSKYADAFNTTEVGKDTVNGAPTTKYQVDVDLQKLYSLMGMTDPSTTEIAKNSKMTIFMWVGDADQYLHKEQVVFDMKLSVPSSTGSGTTETSFTMDITITFKDFNTPITIEVPTNAEPLGQSSVGSPSSASFTGMPTSFNLLGSLAGMPSAAPAGSTSGMPTGMPKTGAGDLTLPLAMLILALACLAVGVALRRLTLAR